MKKFFLTLAFAGLVMVSQAQETIQVSEEVVVATDGRQVVTNPYGGNWFISANGGIHLYNGVVTKGQSPFEHISPAVSVYGGKWHSPGFGWRVGYNGLNIKPFKNSTHYAFVNFHFDALLNLSNMIFGYNEARIWNLIPFVGAGWAGRTYEEGGLTGTLSANYGILNTFRIAERMAINVELSGHFFRNGFSGKAGKEGHDMMWSLTAGITYRLGRVGWSPAIDPAVLQAAYGGVIAELEADIVEAGNRNEMARREIASLNRRLEEMNAECRKMKVQEVHNNVVDFKQSVFFPFGSSSLDSMKEQLNIEAYAKAAAAAGVKLKVIGFTDTSGSVKYNEELSKQRAESVAEMLRANGATVETVIGQGESEEYKTMYLNRRAIIEVVK